MFPAAAQAIVFDVVGTLVEPAPTVAEAYRETGLRYGQTLDVAEIQRRFTLAWRSQEQADATAEPPFATNDARERRRWRAIVADVFAAAEPKAGDAIFADLWDHFARPSAWRSLPAGQALARAAVDAGLLIALASNFDSRLFGIAATLEPLSWARHVFASSDLGWRKPAPEFFRAVEARLGLPAAALVLVGDDPTLDIAAARAAGWGTLRVAAD